jgi:hypothetical protein
MILDIRDVHHALVKLVSPLKKGNDSILSYPCLSSREESFASHDECLPLKSRKAPDHPVAEI